MKDQTSVWTDQRHAVSGFTTFTSLNWGVRTDRVVPADYDGDGLTDPAVFRPSMGESWILQSGIFGHHRPRLYSAAVYLWGTGSDRPVPGDYDGDGKADLAIFRLSLPETPYPLCQLRLPATGWQPFLRCVPRNGALGFKEECLDRLMFFDEAHLRQTLSEFVAHYHRERNHQGLHDRLIAPETLGPPDAHICCRIRLGGLLRYDHRAA